MDRSVGIAIATFNSEAVIRRCLAGFDGRDYIVVIYDDASADQTVATARAARPSVEILAGDGTAWWAGGTRAAVRRCFEQDCDVVVLLNPDVFLSGRDVDTLVNYVADRDNVIAGALVVSDADPSEVAWAGSRFLKIWSFPPTYTSRYVHRAGTPVDSVGDLPYAVDEVHGRGVVISRGVFTKVGELDADVFPHYGGDNDYSWRARRLGVEIHILPSVRARLVGGMTGEPMWATLNYQQKARAVVNYLLRRKNGAALPTLWKLYRRHVPVMAVLPSMLLHIALTISGRMGWRRPRGSAHAKPN